MGTTTPNPLPFVLAEIVLVMWVQVSQWDSQADEGWNRLTAQTGFHTHTQLFSSFLPVPNTVHC